MHSRTDTLDLAQPCVMGIVNVTPDSFSDGGLYVTPAQALQRIEQLIEEGASIADIGAESTRPGSVAISEDLEWKRLGPILKELYRHPLPLWISIDTSKSGIAQRALDLGVHIINDVTALSDDETAFGIARHKAAVVLMHGYLEHTGADTKTDVCSFLQQRVVFAQACGISKTRIVLDPGIGFGKNTQENISATHQLPTLVASGSPVLYGPSRKRFLGEILGRTHTHAHPEQRDAATAAACVMAFLQGARLFRVHDVVSTVDSLRVAQAMRYTLW